MKTPFFKVAYIHKKKPKCFLFCLNARFKQGIAIEVSTTECSVGPFHGTVASYGRHLCLNPILCLPVLSPWEIKKQDLRLLSLIRCWDQCPGPRQFYLYGFLFTAAL